MRNSKRAVIVGSGFIGIELLEAFVKNGLFVDIIEKNDRLMPSFDGDMSELIEQRLNNYNDGTFQTHTSEIVTDILGENGFATGVKTLSGKYIPTDMVILSVGVKPNSEIARDAGIVIGETGAIHVNKHMETSIKNIYACGDCCEEKHLISGKYVWVPLGSTANKEGECAALNAAGIDTEFEGVLGSSVTRCLNTTMSMTGLTESQALESGYSPVFAVVSKTDKVAYMPDVGEITLKVMADKFTGLLLGGQAVGSIGADKRINALATALLGHLTVQEFKRNDLTYSPPYSPTIDPLLTAMSILCKRVSKPC